MRIINLRFEVKTIIIIFIFLILPNLSMATKKVIRNAFSFVYAKPNILSKVLYILEEGREVRIMFQKRNWAKIKINNKFGYIHIKMLSDKLVPVNENIYNILVKKLKRDDFSSTKKSFSEEDELSAASKGFSEEDELSAASKGFSEEDELSAASKGFSEEDELSAASKGFSEEDELSAASKGFSEEDELSAASKGFSEEDELSAASKGFSEEDELSAASKGFSEEDELSAASKGFSKKRRVKNKGAINSNLLAILKKYSFFKKRSYIKDQLFILKVLRKYSSAKKK